MWEKIKYISILTLILSSIFVDAQILRFKHYTVDDGLSQSAVNCIYQSKDGYLWFGTQGGINRFNGYNFKVFAHDPLKENSLSSNWVWSIAEDKQGNLWIATAYGLNKFNPKTEKITRYFHDDKDPGSLPDDAVYAVYVDKDNTVWVKTIKHLSKLNNKTNKFVSFEQKTDIFFSPTKSDFPFKILETKDGLWVGSFSGLHHFNKLYEKFEYFEHKDSDPNSISDNTIYSIISGPNGYIWIGTQKGLDMLDPKTKKITHFKHNDNDPNSLVCDQIISLSFDHKGFLWIGTRNGISRFNPRNLSFLNYKPEKNNPESLSYPEISSIFEDNSENVWLGTNGNGIDFVSLRPPKFKLYRYSSNSHSYNLTENMIASVYVDNKNQLWIGTWNTGLNILNRATGNVKVFNTESPEGNKIIDNHVHAIYELKNGNVLLGTENGLSVYDIKTNRFFDYSEKYNINLDKLKGNRIFSITQDSDSLIWLATSLGLHVINPQNNTITSYTNDTHDSTTIAGNTVVDVMEDSEGYIWVATQNGLSKLDKTTGKFKQYVRNNKLNNHIKGDLYKSLSTNYSFDLVEDDKGYIWIGTTSGINRFDKINEVFKYYTKKHGLPDETVYDLIRDDSGKIWFSTNRGLGYLDPDLDFIKSFDKGDGIQGLEYNNGASYKSKKGEIFFGGQNGLNSFYPDSIVENDHLPQMVIESYVKISTKYGIQEFTLKGKDQIIMNADDKSITLKFAALEFTNPAKNQYMYKLEGYDNDWFNSGTTPWAIYSNLPQGTYTFWLKGSNNDLKWSEPISIKIKVNPPFYLSYWAYTVYAILIIIIISLIIRLRTQKLKSVNEDLREKQLQSMEIAKQKEALDVLIKNIKDSITYAERIQKALLPSEFLFKKLLPESFVLFRPKDIVSGDFYWIAEKDNKVFVAAVDCTGHGVPGAFMSIIGFDLLRNITRDQGIEDPGEILSRMSEGVAEAFSKNIGEQEVKDGMDISLIVLDKNLNRLEYAGALNPLYVIRDQKVIEIKGNRFSIGSSEQNVKFDTHKINLKPNDMLYIFSDGYADQFGGPLGKKYKYRRYRHTLLTISKMSMAKQKQFLNENLDNWMGDLEQVDDILVIGIRV